MTPSQQAALEQVAREYIQCLPFTGTLGEYDNAVRKLVTLLAAQRAAVLEEVEEKARSFTVGFDIHEWMISTKKEMGQKVMLAFADWVHQQAQEQRP